MKRVYCKPNIFLIYKLWLDSTYWSVLDTIIGLWSFFSGPHIHVNMEDNYVYMSTSGKQKLPYYKFTFLVWLYDLRKHVCAIIIMTWGVLFSKYCNFL